jgi:hypothetical protein
MQRDLRAKKRLKRELSITAVMRHFRAPGNLKRRTLKLPRFDQFTQEL